MILVKKLIFFEITMILNKMLMQTEHISIKQKYAHDHQRYFISKSKCKLIFQIQLTLFKETLPYAI